LEDVALCDVGLDLAKDFLVSCGLAVDKINEGNSAATRHAFNLMFNRVVEHSDTSRCLGGVWSRDGVCCLRANR
jgi:hydrogenase maturation factor